MSRTLLLLSALALTTSFAALSTPEDEWVENSNDPQPDDPLPAGAGLVQPKSSALAEENDAHWQRIKAEQSTPLGGESATTVDTSGKKFAFIKAELDRIRSKCNRDPIKTFEVTDAKRKIIQGIEYHFNVLIDGNVEKSVVMHRRAPDQQHPTTEPTDGDSPDKKGETHLRDLFSLVSVDPHPCPENFGAEFASLDDDDLPHEFPQGLVLPSEEEMNYVEMELTDEQKASLPTNWDWRDHMPGTPAKAADALNQGSCGSCWAFGAATTMAYRLNIASNGKYNAVPSPQIGMSCAKGSGACNGGWFSNFYNAMRDNNIPAHWSEAYTGKPGSCPASSSKSIAYKAKNAPGSTRTGPSITGVDAMMLEIKTNGPAGMAINAGDTAFQRYKSGVAQTSVQGSLSHAITVLGWGTMDGVKYWLVQNSWGAGWGDGGFMKIERGKNTLSCEKSGALPGYAATTNMECSSSPACKNGGAFKKDCSCHCLSGYSGATCNSCQKTCSGAQYTGQAGIVAGSCRCSCNAGYSTPSNLRGYGDCAMKWSFTGTGNAAVEDGKLTVASGPVNFDFSEVGTTPSDKLQRVKKGDMLVAVAAGSKPWTAEGGWNTDIKANVCAAKAWPAEPCVSGSGSLAVPSKAAAYDVYYVKYNGMSEFGQDKGYGSDFMLLPDRLCVGGVDCDSAPPPPPPPPPAPEPPPPPPACQDKGSSCESWAKSYDCSKTYKIGGESTKLNVYCCVSCGGGSKPTPKPTPKPAPRPSPSPPSPSPSVCSDKGTSCPAWSKSYDCTATYKIGGVAQKLNAYCCKSCGGGATPTPKPTPPPTSRPTPPPTRRPTPPPTRRPTPPPTSKPTPPPPSGCSDKGNSCSTWVTKYDCTKTYKIGGVSQKLNAYCCTSCKSTPTPKPTPPPSSGSCTDTSTRGCPQWAGTYDCSRMFKFGGATYGTKLSTYCCKSCAAKGEEMVELKKMTQLELVELKDPEEPQIEPIVDGWTEAN